MTPIDGIGLHKDHYTGAMNEVKAQAYYLEQGYQVYTPIVQQSWVDFIVEKDSTLFKVQVKTATWNTVGSFKYLQSRVKLTNKYGKHPKDLYDILDVLSSDTIWEIPSSIIDTTNLSLANNNDRSKKEYKWDEYIVN